MRFPWRISLYYKLFFVFGLTFIGVVAVLGESLQRPFDPDDARIIGVQLATCVFLLFLNSVAVRRLLKPMRKLTDFSREFSEGKLDSRVQIKTKDEIGEMGHSFNAMADRIQTQMESLKHMAVGVSHEIRTPLTRMRVGIEMLSDQKTKELLAEQIREIDGITATILEREALEAGISELRLESVDLEGLLSELAAHFRNSGQSIIVEATAAIVKGDRRRLEMCFKNLLDNCFVHGRSEKPVKVSLSRDGNMFVVRIADQGSGIRDNKKSGGFGLGLKLSESIVRAHQGTLSIRSEGMGTVAELTLPI